MKFSNEHLLITISNINETNFFCNSNSIKMRNIYAYLTMTGTLNVAERLRKYKQLLA